jgi:hypothetical protein
MAKVKNSEVKTEEVLPVKESKEFPKFTCNVNFNNKEYKQGEEWTSEIPEAIKSFLK